jgi:hypothetical protein
VSRVDSDPGHRLKKKATEILVPKWYERGFFKQAVYGAFHMKNDGLPVAHAQKRI